MIRLFPAIEPRPQKTLKGTGIKKKPEIESHYIYMQSVCDNAMAMQSFYGLNETTCPVGVLVVSASFQRSLVLSSRP